MKYRITAYSYRTESTETLAQPRSWAGAGKRLTKDGEFWRRMGWDDIALEVDDGTSGGWRPPFQDELPRRGELPRPVADELWGQAIPRNLRVEL